MATRKKTVNHQQNNVNSTFDTSSTESTVVEEQLFGQAEEDEDGDDGPVVFICAKCRLPVGDSASWDGSEDGQNQIRLKREFWFYFPVFSYFLGQKVGPRVRKAISMKPPPLCEQWRS